MKTLFGDGVKYIEYPLPERAAMGTFDTYKYGNLEVQLKVGPCILSNYEIGDSVEIPDGIYHGNGDGIVIILFGKLHHVLPHDAEPRRFLGSYVPPTYDKYGKVSFAEPSNEKSMTIVSETKLLNSKHTAPKENSMAEVKLINAYKVSANSDLNEGRGHTIILGYYSNRNAATLAAKGQDVMGTDAKVEPINLKCVDVNGQLHLIGGKIEILDNYISPKELKEAALAKLTPAERRVLGV